ncbi:hypothetical protein [Actinoplanes sp. NPDC049118]|uniref:hypothetical protein n=1 Tax=Actinoplanes sp. NPDC049118 TaxID=3155769 RepID=UPI0033E207C8
MSEPTADEMFRAVTAVMPFVRRWQLPLNPEDVEELAYAVPLHARSDRTVAEIDTAVQTQIDQHRQRARHLYEAMRAASERDEPFRRE